MTKPALASLDDPVPFVDLGMQHEALLPEFEALLRDVVRQSMFIQGPHVEIFEKAFAKFHHVPHAIGCASGTDALILAARALDLKPGDEVISVPNTWISTIFAISHTGATPVLADVDPQTGQIDVKAAEKAITPRTKAVFPVHMFGHPADLTALAALCRKHNLALVEDTAQAVGAQFDGKLCGTVGDIGCFSFFPSKNLGCLGDGGCVLTKRGDLAERLRRLGDYGQNPRYTHNEIGYNSRLDTLQAAFLLAKLPHLPSWTEARRRIAARYNELLKDLPVTTPHEHPKARAVYHLYVIEVEERDACLDYLRQNGVMAQIHYPNLVPFQPCYARLGYKKGDFPVAERLNSRILSLPIYPELSEMQQDRVVETLKRFFDSMKGKN
ncbi:MAG: DegT/DnrJ/EryC1/StrS family aminotransferase [Alphaproteobacteria bacterium]|nr:DegT/DnrJ/EryC1/StrS family aminotransferase [Alphaproteobacteria bacterium]